ncbi:MAG: sigma-70 family RNA polymerase sigma factor [Oscillospiraceae bacterium]|nr:sigma-70 family RNA polymerase sigma factor [Oscillospiraceae bacterium]
MNEETTRQRMVYDTYFNYVYAISRRILRDCGSTEDVEECVIDTFAEVLPRLPEIREDAVRAYLGTAAKHRALNMARALSRQRSRSVPMDSIAELSAPQTVEEHAEDAQLRTLLLQKIAELGEPDMTILIQKYYYDCDAKEIARRTGLSAAAVRQRCSRAIKRLKEELSDWDLQA